MHRRRNSLMHAVALTAAILFLQAMAAAFDLDGGKDASGLAKVAESWKPGAGSFELNGWVRLRGADLAKMPETRDALEKLRKRGLKTCIMLRWPANDPKAGYLPQDLREAYERGRKLGAAYGDLVDAWEVDNEPDLGAVPEMAENYAVFLKATYLGLQRGFADARLKAENPQVSGLLPQPPAGHSLQSASGHGSAMPSSPPGSVKSQVSARAPLLLMGALGLPPGPWLERFAANDGFSYTDGFNYHYYGYAEDFSGVYRQFESAVQTLGTENSVSSATSVFKKDWPIFLTEIGYGMLGKATRDTKEGRLRQWRWFKTVGEQAGSLRIEAPMAFYLQPYLEYDTLEFGLTVPAVQKPEDEGQKTERQVFPAGGIAYTAEDFGAKSAEPWMTLIGKGVGGNEVTPALAWWLAARHPEHSKQRTGESKSWTINVPVPSPVVIDFLAGEGLSSIKRYNGSFVLGKEPLALRKPETGDLKPEIKKPKPAEQKPGIPPVRTEEFMVHVRTANGNLYEVYPTRLATPEWQGFSESQGNFTLSFYGRAELPWRFKDNRPASLVVVMYPKSLPVTYEFRRVQLVKIGQTFNTEAAARAEKVMRYGSGKIVLYNFSDKPVSGRLVLPKEVTTEYTEHTETNNSAKSVSSVLKLSPGERCEIPVTIKVPRERFERIPAEIQFIPDNLQVSGFSSQVSVSRFLTAFMPDIGGMQSTVVAKLLEHKTEDGEQRTESGSKLSGLRSQVSGLSNRSLIATRQRATEEAPMMEQGSVFAQQGATVERTNNGFTVTVAGTPPGKQQRVEVEIPWPEGQSLSAETFLTLEYRLHP